MEVMEAARRAAAHVIVDGLDSPVLSNEDAHHLGSVLRLRPGETVSAINREGAWRLCEWAGGDVLQPVGEVVRVERPAPAVCVAFAPVKGDRNEWAVQKLTELGVDRILLVRSERSVVRWDAGRSATQISRLQRVVQQAVMQSRGLWVPPVEGIVALESVAGRVGSAVADPSGTGSWTAVTTVIVGPEGGWSEKEWEAYGADAVRIGGGVLRTESAAVAAGVLLTAIRAGVVAGVVAPIEGPGSS
jgi:16S rRNA (uracil1498-N3)-methyltransferase